MKIYIVPMGRMKDQKHESPERTAYEHTADFNVRCTIFPSRNFMINCLKKDNKKKAVIKDVVSKGLVMYSNYQREDI